MDLIEVNGFGFEGYTIELNNAKLLLIKGKKGILACGYLNIETADKMQDAMAIVKGVNSYEDMFNAKVVIVSKAALELAVNITMTGIEPLEEMER